jgi:hypothetical protein
MDPANTIAADSDSFGFSLVDAEEGPSCWRMESKTGLLAFSSCHHAVQSKTGQLIILNMPVQRQKLATPLFN